MRITAAVICCLPVSLGAEDLLRQPPTHDPTSPFYEFAEAESNEDNAEVVTATVHDSSSSQWFPTFSLPRLRSPNWKPWSTVDLLPKFPTCPWFAAASETPDAPAAQIPVDRVTSRPLVAGSATHTTIADEQDESSAHLFWPRIPSPDFVAVRSFIGEALGPRAARDDAGTSMFASFDYLNWQLRRRDLDYAVSSSNDALAIGTGTIHNVSFGQDSGFRTLVGVQFDSGWRVGIGYTNFTTSATSNLTRSPGETLFSTRSHPKYNEEAIDANADARFDFHVLDLEARHSLEASERAQVDVFGGFRWGKVDQLLAVRYDGFDFIHGSLDHSVKTRSFGLRMGVEGMWKADGGLYIFGSGEGSLMYGKYDTQLLETDNEFGLSDTLVDIHDSYEHVIPTIAASAGLGWVRKNVEVRIGYELNSWFNLGDRLVFLDDTHEALYSHSNHDLLMDGFFLRLTFEK